MNIKEISELCGVSTCTVSRVLSGRGKEYRISDKTAERIFRIAADTGYRPNYLAHSLNTGKTNSIGVVLANRLDSYLGGIVEGIESHLRGTEYQMVVATCDNSPDIEKEEVEQMLYRHVDGMIIYPLAPPREPAEAAMKYEAPPTSDEVPLVIVGRKASVEADEVMLGDYPAGQSVAQNFMAAGCRTFAVVTRARHCSSDYGRERGFVDALREAGVEQERITIIANRETPSEEEINRLKTAEAIFGVNSFLLLEYLEWLRRTKDISRLRLSSVGEVEGSELFDLLFEPLIMPSRQLGVEAARMLLWRIENPGAPCRHTEISLLVQ
ncbi:MAG: LacI family transcriptional regulator [Verrucomicrobia bacterium]|nr:LacI family transcriptional regulator [Verrucomicrobiota bacterium]